MSKLEELIEQYCPDGVEYVRLGDTAQVCRGTRVVKSQLTEVGYPVYQNCLTPMGYFESTNCPKGTTFVICGGAAGNIGYTDVDCWAADDCEYIECGHTILNRYVYYCLMYRQHYLLSKVRKASIPRLSPSIIKDLEIPVPPLPVQEEIVRILDAFTELQAELQAELQKRKQQYNYYRDNILTNFTPNQKAQEYTLEAVTKDIYSGATPSKEKKEYWEDGTIPWMSSGEANLGQVYEVEGRITQLGYDKCSTKMVPEGSVVIALAGQGKTRGTVALLKTSVCTNQSLAALVPNTDFVSGEYLFHYLKTQYSKLRNISSGDGTRGGLNLKMLRTYKVIVPSKEAQSQIVSILDRFDTLTNDLTAGLPAEIEKRRQQYEYYRDKLLTFKRKEA